MNEVFLTTNLDENIKLISSNAPANFNFINREILLKREVRCNILYINGLVNKQYIEEFIIKPLLFMLDTDMKSIDNPHEYISKHYLASSSITFSNSLTNISSELKTGKTILLIDHTEYAVICDTVGGEFRTIQESTVEKSVRGPKDAFVENIDTNIAIIQRRICSNHLKIENFVIGEDTQTTVSLVYLDNKISAEILNNIRNKLALIKIPSILESGYIEQLTQERPFNIFPQIKSTERPTKAAADIIEGKAVILTNGSPIVLVVPAVFIEFFQGIEDYTHRNMISTFVRILRIIAVFIVVTSTPIYLTLVIYDVELIPPELIKVIVDSRLGIPIPPLLEILAMELFVELLREGGLRLPTPIGQTLSIVGGIVIGDTVVKANLVSPTTLMVITLSVVATFLIPNYEMSLSIRLLRFPMLILAQLLGFLGIIIGLNYIVITLIRMESFGVPYLVPLAPVRYKDLWDTMLSFPIAKINKQPVSFKSSPFRRNKNGKS
jgi:spore germination protein KA